MLPEIINPIDHVHIHHNESDGWIALFKKDNGRFGRQRLYKANELDKQMSEWIGEDVYFSQNTFYKPTRTVDSIRQLRALYVDIDCHLFNLIPEYTLRKLETELFKEKVPEPNIITFSGRGLNCVWFLEPSPYQALPLWQAIEDYLVKVFKEVGDIGTDEKVRDASRVLRLAGSINSKNGEKVTVQHRHNYKYSLREIQEEYLPELTPKKAKPAKVEPKQGRPTKVATIHKSRILHFDRWNDIKKLAELRNYDLKGHRELLCFLYRYWSCFYVRNPEEALYQTIQFNAQFLEPLPEREVINATKSAEQAFLKQTNKELNAIAKAKGYPGAGYNLTNETLIGWLGITEEEQVQLKTIISKDEKKRRKKMANRELRGSVSREEYMKKHEGKTEDKLNALKKLLQDNPKAKKTELAELLKISRKHLYSLLKQLD